MVNVINSFLNDNIDSGNPNAFLSCLIFDENLKLKEQQCMKKQVSIDNLWHNLQLPDFECMQNGFVYIFCSNGAETSVFFDDIEIEHTTGNLIEEVHYYPFGLSFGRYTAMPEYSKNKKLFNSQQYEDDEWANNKGIKWYDFDNRNYDPQIGRWHCVDPRVADAPGWSPYNAMWNNPIKFVDPDGQWAVDHIDVTKNKDGTYNVVGGQANSDESIYVVDGSGKRTGEVVGQMLTEFSFHHEDGSAVVGANINLNDQSGHNFFNNKIKNVGLFDYIGNAKGEQPLDFKHKGMNDRNEGTTVSQHHYRGMSFDGKVASARDIGNYSAGYVAGKHGFGWGTSRFAFDALETKQAKGTWNTLLYYPFNRVSEGQPTQQAQRAGHNIGYTIFKQQQFEREWKKATNPWPTGLKY